MRYGIRQDARGVVISAKRNNWHPRDEERELPESLEHLASSLVKVGEERRIGPTHIYYSLLAASANGQDPAESTFEEAANRIAENLHHEMSQVLRKMNRRGLRPQNGESILSSMIARKIRQPMGV